MQIERSEEGFRRWRESSRRMEKESAHCAKTSGWRKCTWAGIERRCLDGGETHFGEKL
jgi:hypothetical protein